MAERAPVVGYVDLGETDVPESGVDLGNLRVVRELDRKLVTQLVNLTNSSNASGDFVSDQDIFGSLEKYLEWRNAETRFVYGLTNEKGELYGMYWLTEVPLPKSNWDFTEDFQHEDYNLAASIRLYGEAKGKRLARQFGHLIALGDFMEVTAGRYKGIWAIVAEDNASSRGSLQKDGYRCVTSPNEESKLLYIYDLNADSRSNSTRRPQDETSITTSVEYAGLTTIEVRPPQNDTDNV